MIPFVTAGLGHAVDLRFDTRATPPTRLDNAFDLIEGHPG